MHATHAMPPAPQFEAVVPELQAPVEPQQPLQFDALHDEVGRVMQVFEPLHTLPVGQATHSVPPLAQAESSVPDTH